MLQFGFDDFGAYMRNDIQRLKQVCGAKNRQGSPCQVKQLYPNGRCKFHGGLSTGCRTDEGKARSLAALRAGWLRWRNKL